MLCKAFYNNILLNFSNRLSLEVRMDSRAVNENLKHAVVLLDITELL